LAWRQDLPGKTGHGKGELIALGVGRKGRLIRARGRDLGRLFQSSLRLEQQWQQQALRMLLGSKKGK